MHDWRETCLIVLPGHRLPTNVGEEWQHSSLYMSPAVCSQNLHLVN